MTASSSRRGFTRLRSLSVAARPRRDGRRGFTLIELILYVGLTAIIVVALTRVLLTIIGTRERVEIVGVLQQETRFAFDRMIAETLHAQSVLTGASLFDQPGGTLVLLREESGSGSAIAVTTFSLSGSTVVIATGTGGFIPLTSSRTAVLELLFHSLSEDDPPRTIRIRLHAMDAREATIGRRDEVTLETTISLRNR